MLQNRLFELEEQFEESTGEKLEQHIRLRQIRSIHQNLSEFLSVRAPLPSSYSPTSTIAYIQTAHSYFYCTVHVRFTLIILLVLVYSCTVPVAEQNSLHGDLESVQRVERVLPVAVLAARDRRRAGHVPAGREPRVPAALRRRPLARVRPPSRPQAERTLLRACVRDCGRHCQCA